jgi:teichuronic acid biosynthesis glycosyltransferase TuaH
MKKILFADSHYFDEYFVLGQHQYATLFADHSWDVAFVPNPLSPFNVLLGKNKKGILARILNHIRGGDYNKRHLWYYIPFTFIPFHNHTVFNKEWFLNNYYMFSLPSIRSTINKKGFSSVDVLWLGTAHQKFWLNILDYKCCIYRIADNFKNSDVLIRAQETVTESADIILVTSKVLLGRLEQKFRSKKLVYIPNGVDLSNFIRSHYRRPRELQNLNNKIALYVGAIGEWFDQKFLMNVAKNCPEISFVIIGVDGCRKMRNISEKNVHFLGPRPYESIPDYIYYSDCGIIPFDNSEIVQSISPIKMYEFFSLGKPVISSAWEELRLINAPCFLATNANEFTDILKDKNTYRQNSQSLIDYAKLNTWSGRYFKILEIIDNYLGS